MKKKVVIIAVVAILLIAIVIAIVVSSLSKGTEDLLKVAGYTDKNANISVVVE